MFLPKVFLEKIKDIIQDDNEFEKFIDAQNTRLRKCFRVNTLKAELNETAQAIRGQGLELDTMPWYKYGFFVRDSDTNKVKIGNTLQHFLGEIYVQEAASMLPVIALNPEENDVILDMAASPGSKTTQIAMHLNNKGNVVANEPLLSRIPQLQDNLDRSGSLCHAVVRHDGRMFKRMPNTFHKVLIDAPCSVEGTFRKDLKARELWTQNKVQELSRLQMKLLDSAITTAQSGATIVYSTCTFSPEENELVVSRVLEEHPEAKIVPVEFEGIEFSPGIKEFRNYKFCENIERTVRIWPQKVNMEGFYLAKIIKE